MRHLLLAVLIILFSCQSLGSSLALRFSEVNLKDGLSQATVLDMIKDRQGFMWFATQDGLNRYDGYDFVVYRQEQDNPKSLSENYISSLFEDSNGYIWLTTRNGLNRFDPKTNTFERYYYNIHDPYSLASNWTYGVNEDHLGHIWVGSFEDGLSVFNPNTNRFIHYRHDKDDPNSLSDDGIYDIFIDRTGVIWVATRKGGVSRFNTEKNNFTRFIHDPDDPTSISHNTVFNIYQDSDGTIWFATRGGGLNRFDQQTQSFVRYQHDPNDPSSISSDHVWTIVEDRSGNLLLGTFTDGISRLVKGTDKFDHIKHEAATKNGLSSNSVLASYADDSGIIWFGVRDVGLNLFNQETSVFEHYRYSAANSNSLSDNAVQTFLQLDDGDILIGTREGGVNRFNADKGTFNLFHQPDDPTHDLLAQPTNHIIEDKAGNVWIAFKNDGVVKYDSKTGQFTNYRHDPKDSQSISSNTVMVMLADDDGKIWLGGKEGLSLLDPQTGKSTHYIHQSDDESSIGSNWITHLMFDYKKQLWVSTLKGLDLFNKSNGEFRHYRHDPDNTNSLSSNSVMSVFEDNRRMLWVATTSGLNEYDPESGTYTRYQKEQGLSNDQVYGVLQDNDGFLWIITNFGLNRLDTTTGDVKWYTQQDGLQGNEFNQGTFAKLTDGRLMVGGGNGFNLFDPREIKSNPYPPVMQITNFRVSNYSIPVGPFELNQRPMDLLEKSINYTDEINLTHEESVVSFEFSALHFSAPTLNRFAYRLNGFDDEWTSTDYKNRRATYTNLEPGKYTFEIKGANKDDVWSAQPARVELIVVPPWWLSKAAKFLWLAAFFISVNVLYRLKTNQIRKQKSDLQLQVTRQVAQVVQQKRALETSYNDIKILSGIGQRINASLDLEKVLWAVYEDINKLMDGTVFGIGLYQPEHNRIKIKLAMEKGNRYKPYYRSMDDKNQFPVWCIDHDEVVFVNDLELDGRRYLQSHEYDDHMSSRVPIEDGQLSGLPQSFIYVPMRSSDKILGYLSVQSFNRHAYQEVHVDILKTLAAYTGTAIINSKEHQELLDSRKELIESEKMASLGALTAGVAHEINNPTNFVHVSAQNLEYDLGKFQDFIFGIAGEDAEEEVLESFKQQFIPLYEHINTIKDGTQRIKTIVHDLRAFTHLDAADKKKVSITENILSTIHLVQTQFMEYVEFVTDFVDEPEVECYPAQLNQVYMNIIVNACDAIRDKHHQNPDLAEKGQIIIRCKALEDYAEVTIQDNGNGMSDATKKRLFEPFYTTKDVGKGSGLGLSISNGIVKKHSGKLTVDSKPGTGTTFRLLLPYKSVVIPLTS